MSAGLTLLAFALAWPYGRMVAIGVLVGGAFGIINMMLLGRLITAIIKAGPIDPIEVAVTFLVKFPIAIGLIFCDSPTWLD